MKPLNYFLLVSFFLFTACNSSVDEDTNNKHLIQTIIQDEDFLAVVETQRFYKGRYESTRMAINFWLDIDISDIGSLSQEEYLSLREQQRQKAAAFGEKLRERQRIIEEKLKSSKAELNDAAWERIKADVDQQLGIPEGFVARYKMYVEELKEQANKESEAHSRLYEKYPELEDENFLKRCISAYLDPKRLS